MKLSDKFKGRFYLAVLALVIIASVCLHLRNIWKAKKQQARIEQLAAAADRTIKDEPVKVYIRDSILHYVYIDKPAATKAEKYEAVGTYIDTVSKALKVAVSTIEEVTKVNAALQAENIKLKRQTNKADTSKNSNIYAYTDKYLNIQYNADSNLATINYALSLNVAKYQKRKWLLGQKQSFVDFYADDKRVNIAGVKRYTLPAAKPRRFGVGISAGYAIMSPTLQPTPYIGVGINYNIISLF